jgi:uncharacterized membrane protein required for colicin V production
MGFDAGFLIILLFGAVRGHRLGFARQVIGLAGLVIGILFGEPLAKFLLPSLTGNLEAFPQSVRLPILFVATWIGLWLLIVIAGCTYLKVYRQHVFGRNVPSPGDRYFGAGLGAAKAAVIVAIVVYAINHLPAAVRETQPIARHYHASKAIEIFNAARPVEIVLDLREMRRVRAHLAELVDYYRTSQEQQDSTANVAARQKKSQ